MGMTNEDGIWWLDCDTCFSALVASCNQARISKYIAERGVKTEQDSYDGRLICTCKACQEKKVKKNGNK